MTVRVFQIPHHWVMTDLWTKTTLEKGLDDRHYKEEPFAGEAVDVVRPDGVLLFALRPQAILLPLLHWPSRRSCGWPRRPTAVATPPVARSTSTPR
jgi:hypothetical protein